MNDYFMNAIHIEKFLVNHFCPTRKREPGDELNQIMWQNSVNVGIYRSTTSSGGIVEKDALMRLEQN